jgi:hypothetical protein
MVIEAARRNPHVVFVGLNPGIVSTEIRTANSFVPGWVDRILQKTLAVRPAAYVQSCLINAAVSLSVDSLSGRLVGPRNQVYVTDAPRMDTQAAGQLWSLSMTLGNLTV